MVQTIQIRRMELQDIERIMDIEKRSFADPWSESAYITEISNTSAYYIVICVDGAIAGFAGMWVIMDEAHITTIAVDPDHRRIKLGERLLINILEESVSRGAKRATLEVRQSNTAAQNLYRKFQFKAVAMRRGYYTDNNENALIMWANEISKASYWNEINNFKNELP